MGEEEQYSKQREGGHCLSIFLSETHISDSGFPMEVEKAAKSKLQGTVIAETIMRQTDFRESRL